LFLFEVQSTTRTLAPRSAVRNLTGCSADFIILPANAPAVVVAVGGGGARERRQRGYGGGAGARADHRQGSRRHSKRRLTTLSLPSTISQHMDNLYKCLFIFWGCTAPTRLLSAHFFPSPYRSLLHTLFTLPSHCPAPPPQLLPSHPQTAPPSSPRSISRLTVTARERHAMAAGRLPRCMARRASPPTEALNATSGRLPPCILGAEGLLPRRHATAAGHLPPRMGRRASPSTPGPAPAAAVRVEECSAAMRQRGDDLPRTWT
jgi:hypothetical protein